MKLGARMNYYQVCCKPDQVLGVSPHSDASSLTILLEEGKINGLQIKYKWEWIPERPVQNTVVVNIGNNVIEAWSKGKYQSIKHRTLTNEEKARVSLATFVLPIETVEIGPVVPMVDEIHHPKMYKKVEYLDFMRHYFTRKLKLDNKDKAGLSIKTTGDYNFCQLQ